VAYANSPATAYCKPAERQSSVSCLVDHMFQRGSGGCWSVPQLLVHRGDLVLQTVDNNLAAVVGMAFFPQPQGGRSYIRWHQTGLIYYCLDTQQNPQVKSSPRLTLDAADQNARHVSQTCRLLIDMSNVTDSSWDRGLLSLAIHPDWYNGSPYVFVGYDSENWATRPSWDTGRDNCVRQPAYMAQWTTPADYRDWCARDIVLVRLRVRADPMRLEAGRSSSRYHRRTRLLRPRC
jgi:hypothetical protein